MYDRVLPGMQHNLFGLDTEAWNYQKSQSWYWGFIVKNVLLTLPIIHLIDKAKTWYIVLCANSKCKKSDYKEQISNLRGCNFILTVVNIAMTLKDEVAAFRFSPKEGSMILNDAAVESLV